jgi:hypothetical protein
MSGVTRDSYCRAIGGRFESVGHTIGPFAPPIQSLPQISGGERTVGSRQWAEGTGERRANFPLLEGC